MQTHRSARRNATARSCSPAVSRSLGRGAIGSAARMATTIAAPSPQPDPAWVRQGRTDAWIAHQLEVTVQQIEPFKRENDLRRRRGADGAGARLRRRDRPARRGRRADRRRARGGRGRSAEAEDGEDDDDAGEDGDDDDARRRAAAAAAAAAAGAAAAPRSAGRARGHVRPRRGGLRPVARPGGRRQRRLRRALGRPPPGRGHGRGGPDRHPPRGTPAPTTTTTTPTTDDATPRARARLRARDARTRGGRSRRAAAGAAAFFVDPAHRGAATPANVCWADRRRRRLARPRHWRARPSRLLASARLSPPRGWSLEGATAEARRALVRGTPVGDDPEPRLHGATSADAAPAGGTGRRASRVDEMLRGSTTATCATDPRHALRPRRRRSARAPGRAPPHVRAAAARHARLLRACAGRRTPSPGARLCDADGSRPDRGRRLPARAPRPRLRPRGRRRGDARRAAPTTRAAVHRRRRRGLAQAALRAAGLCRRSGTSCVFKRAVIRSRARARRPPA